jgi:hypothetical protein
MGIFWRCLHILLGNVYEKRPVVVDNLSDPQGSSLINYDMDYPLASCRSRTTSKSPFPGDNTVRAQDGFICKVSSPGQGRVFLLRLILH